jgi:hypothetical protein
LGLFLQIVGDRETGFVAQRGKTSNWVRIFKFPDDPTPRVLQRAAGVFLQEVNRPSELASWRI